MAARHRARAAPAGIGNGSLKNSSAGELDQISDTNFYTGKQALIHLNPSAGAAGMARQLFRELGALDFAILRKAMGKVEVSKTITIDSAGRPAPGDIYR